MRTVDDFAKIRQLHRDGLSARQMAKQLRVARDTVRKALDHPQPLPYALSQPRPALVFGPMQPLVDAILDADLAAPRKQRHTAMQIYRRLVAEHGYTGSYHPIQRYLRSRRLDRRETFIPLDHRPGARAEADFGHIYVDFPDGRHHLPVLIVTWSYSNAPFAIALPTERTEAILHGLVQAFDFFGCVPNELWWDNPTTVAVHILRGRERRLHPRYVALASHYTFNPKFCMPATPTEKPRVENRVKDLQRMWATPVPQVKGIDELNVHLRQCCVTARERTCGEQFLTVSERFEHDRAAALTIPEQAFDACIMQPAQVDKYQTARFDGNRYSVPRRWAFRPVTAKGYIDRVEFVADGQMIASHRRSYGLHEQVLDPLHFLTVLEKKPAALDHAPVYRDWALPSSFVTLRQSLQANLGTRHGDRQFIRLLQLLAFHPQERIEQAILLCSSSVDVSAIIAAVERLARIEQPSDAIHDHRLSCVSVPRPDLARFNQLLTPSPQGDPADVRSKRDAVEGQPQAVEIADDAGGVGEVGP
jgi:transposase